MDTNENFLHLSYNLVQLMQFVLVIVKWSGPEFMKYESHPISIFIILCYPKIPLIYK